MNNASKLPPLIVDGHEDLAWNMLTFGRDYKLPVEETRRKERGGEAPHHNGDTLLGWPEYQKGRVAVVFSTLFAAPERRKYGNWDTETYVNFSQANALYRAQVDVYRRLAEESPDYFRLIFDQKDLSAVLSPWEQDQTVATEEESQEDESQDPKAARELRAPAQFAGPKNGSRGNNLQHSNLQPSTKIGHPVGLVILMEGAEGVRDPAELEEWWGWGVRILGPTWAGTRYSGGTREPGPLTAEGYALLEAMAAFGFTLDLSHMDEKAALQAMDAFSGQIIVSHANALALLKGAETNRHLSNQVIHSLIERDGVIGVVPYNSFLKTGWKRGDPRRAVTLLDLIAHIDHICQIAGDARHAALGSDFDGGFGLQSAPGEINSIADLQKLAPLLAERGYTDTDIAAILGQNWLNMLRRTLPESS